MRKKEIRLYNLLFPIWMFFIWPSVLWLISAAGKFCDRQRGAAFGNVMLSCLENRLSLWKKSIVWIWLIGFLSDFIGAGCLSLF